MDTADLIRRIDAGERLKYLYFWGHTPNRSGEIGAFCLSQWYEAPFSVDGELFATAEHFMMAAKARLFGDERARAAIITASTPGEAKALGRGVNGFDEDRWLEARWDIVVAANVAKFNSSDALAGFLRTTGSRVLVEASPRDSIWGIGLAASDPRAEDPRQWRGLNLLGFALMEARDRLTESAR